MGKESNAYLLGGGIGSLAIVLAYQPHFVDQPADVQVFWGYTLLPDRVGNFVSKPMSECNGAEILRKLCGHLRFDLDVVETKKSFNQARKRPSRWLMRRNEYSPPQS